jgi:N-acetyl-gamma-glutamyl-phosphate reductase
MKAAIIGATGYLGAELLRLLGAHPELELVAAQGDSSVGQPLSAYYPGLGAAYGDLVVGELDLGALSGLDVVFVAVPSGASQAIVSSLVGEARLVVDLGADFRLKDPALYPAWYGFEHQRPELLERAAFGLVELNREAIRSADLIAAPGCYVTAASLALAPLVQGGIIETTGIIVDAASGTSGAGRNPSAFTHHGAVNESFSAYGLLRHRHTPEIEQTIGAQILFTPHLAPMTRGILATCYARPTSASSTEDLLEVLSAFYADEAFVEVTEDAPSTRSTYGTNLCRLSARFDERTGTVLVLSAIDNLTKGGAGQALQGANLALGLPEDLGLSRLAVIP